MTCDQRGVVLRAAAGLVLEASPVGAVVEHAAVVRVRKVRVVLRPTVDHRIEASHQALT